MAQETRITLTQRAAEKVREFMAHSAGGESYLHVALLQTHCMGGRGFTYRLEFEQGLHDRQKTLQSHGIRFSVDDSAASRLSGTDIDYVETIEKQGFVINNPNAIMKCPCGHHDIF